MALNTFAAFIIEGNEIDGDVTMQTIGGVDVSSGHIEIYQLDFGTTVAVEVHTGLTAAHRQILPVTLQKRMDKTTPIFYQALVQNHRVEGSIKIFDIDPDKGGGSRHRFTIRLADARIVSIKSSVPNTAKGDTDALPPFENIEIVAHTIVYVDEIGGTEFQDSWEA